MSAHLAGYDFARATYVRGCRCPVCCRLASVYRQTMRAQVEARGGLSRVDVPVFVGRGCLRCGMPGIRSGWCERCAELVREGDGLRPAHAIAGTRPGAEGERDSEGYRRRKSRAKGA